MGAPPVGPLGVLSATGALLYRDASGNVVELPVGAANQVLTTVGGVPAWAAVAAGAGGDNLWLEGLGIEQNSVQPSQDVDLLLGQCRDTLGTYDMTNPGTHVVKLDGGVGPLGLDTGSPAADSSYFVWLLENSTDQTSSACLSLSSVAPDLTSMGSLDKFRRVGSILTGDAVAPVDTDFAWKQIRLGRKRVYFWTDIAWGAPASQIQTDGTSAVFTTVTGSRNG